MKVTIEIDDVEAMEPFKADALAFLLAGRLPKVKQVEDKPVKTEATEPAKKEARKPRAKAKPVPKAEPEEPKTEAEPAKAEAEPAKAEAEPAKAEVEPSNAEAEQQKNEVESSKPEAEPAKVEPEALKTEPGAAQPRTRDELVKLIVKYSKSKVNGIADVQAQFKELGIKAADQATLEQLNSIAERLGF